MNLVNVCPDISDNWKGGMSDVCRILGINWKTLDRYVKMGKVNATADIKGHRKFSGKEIKRLFYLL